MANREHYCPNCRHYQFSNSAWADCDVCGRAMVTSTDEALPETPWYDENYDDDFWTGDIEDLEGLDLDYSEEE